MSFRACKRQGLPVVRIGGIPYVLDAEKKQLRNALDGEEVIELDEP